MEADLQRYYGVDVRDLWRPTTVLTWRRLRVLLDGLPPESLWFTRLRATLPAQVAAPAADINAIRWGTGHDLLAALIDAVHGVQWTIAQVNSSKPIAAPKPFTRPGTRRTRQGMSARSRARINSWIRTSRRHRGS